MKKTQQHPKYATKTETFWEDLHKWQEGKIISEYPLKPLAVEMEITNRCNCQCPHCGMAANLIVGKHRFKKEECLNLIDDLYSTGIPSIAITGGEPFLEFDNLCALITHAQNKVDICKICSNGFWGDNAAEYIEKLVQCGFLNNQFFVPTILFSIGEQTISLDTIANALHYIVENFSEKELQIGITSLKKHGERGKFMQLIKLYEKKFGKFNHQRIHSTHYFYTNTQFTKHKLDVPKAPIFDGLAQRSNCFGMIMGTEIAPKLMLKSSGEVFPCGCLFNRVEQLLLGNYFEIGMKGILKNFNENKYIKFINERHFIGFRDIIPEEVLKNTYVEDFCYACNFCLDYCEKNGGIDE